MLKLLISLLLLILTACGPAPKDSEGNLSSYIELGKFKGNTIYCVDRGNAMYLYIAVKDKDSSVSSINYTSGKVQESVIIIDNDTVSKEEALQLLNK